MLNAEIKVAPGMSVPSLMAVHTGAVFGAVFTPVHELPSNPHALASVVVMYSSRFEMALMSTVYFWPPGIT